MEGRQKSRRCRKQDGERVCVWMAHFQCSPSTASDSTASHAACPNRIRFPH
ncbi:hypothetical protein C364_02573 [Cryptococcus neoformans Bt63]|nr:hypothetical protein C364_02573 [Cryptococcus neoformans var. grubii Bt63]